MAKEYVVMGAKLECNQATAPSNLVVLPVHREMLTSQLKANIGDAKPFVNVLPFGLCKSMANPAVAAATSANRGTLTPMPCTPACSIWIGGKTDILLDGMPMLMVGDIAVCPLGAGKIEVMDSGQGGGSSGGEVKVDALVLMSKSSHERPDSGLSDLSDEEISRRARDRSLSGEERKRYQKEEKIRGNRNKQKRQNNFSIDLDTIGEIVGLSGAALIIYLIISEGSRIVFPPRNLIPIL